MLFVANSQKAESDADGINLVVRCQIIKLPVLVDLGFRLLLEVLVRVSRVNQRSVPLPFPRRVPESRGSVTG